MFILFILWSTGGAFHSNHFSRINRLSNEQATRTNLKELNDALSLYRKNSKGRSPTDLAALTTGGKYLSSIPQAKAPPYHPPSSEVRFGKRPDDAGGWMFIDDAAVGKIWANCTHTDSKGRSWSSY